MNHSQTPESQKQMEPDQKKKQNFASLLDDVPFSTCCMITYDYLFLSNCHQCRLGVALAQSSSLISLCFRLSAHDLAAVAQF